MEKNKLVYGVGVNDYDSNVNINGHPIRAYRTWQSMLRRCYSDKRLYKDMSYIGCTVSDEWKLFSNFEKWFVENIPTHLIEKGIDVELDKDLLVEGNKVYSKENCIFLPRRVNSFMTNKKSNNTSGYSGVSSYRKNRWQVRIRDFETGKQKFIGLFDDIECASEAYIKARAIESDKVKCWLRSLGYDDSVVNNIK